MKLVIIKNNFKKGLNIIERLTGKNLTLPILNNILIKAEKNSLILKSTDLEIGAEYQTMAKVEEEGDIAIPAKTLSGLVNFLTDENIKIESEKKTNTLILAGKNNKSKIKGLGADDFPIIPQIKNNKKDFMELNSLPFLQGLLKVLNFCSTSQTHPELSGIYFNFQKDKLELVSTDSFRLAKKDIYFQEKKGNNYSFILPQKAVRELTNIISETSEESDNSKVRIYFEPNQIFFDFLLEDLSFPKFKLTSRLIEGDYPNYQEIIPKSYKSRVVLDKDDFLNQIKTTSLFSGNVNKIDIDIDPNKGAVNFFAQNIDLGESKSSMKGEVEGEKGQVSFNFKYLIDGVSNLEGSSVVLELNGEDGPALLKSLEDKDYFYILMPIKS